MKLEPVSWSMSLHILPPPRVGVVEQHNLARWQRQQFLMWQSWQNSSFKLRN